MKTLKLLFLFAFFVASTLSLVAQEKIQVSGLVVDEDGFELIGVTVREKGTNNGTATDLDGKYTLSVPNNGTLEFTYLGMETKEEPISKRVVINVTLVTSAVALDEVVAIGYGTARRGEISSAISSVRGKDLEKLPMTDALQALNGRVAGLQITQGSGAPGANSQVKIRGGISITQNNDPLYIVDGFPSPEGLSSIEPSDILSIDVMKDASSTAIYGAAGANGVILITTKAGSEGRTNINFDTYIGFKKISKRLKVLNTADFVRLEYERSLVRNTEEEMRSFVNVYGTGYNTALSLYDNMQNSWYDIPYYYNGRDGVNWQDEVFDGKTPTTQNYKVSIDGGTKETNYNASFSRTDDEGIMQRSGFERNNFRLRFGHQISKNMSVTFTASHIEDKTTGLGSLEDGGRFSAMRSIIQSRPVGSRDGNDKDLITSVIDPIFKDDSGNVMTNPLTEIRTEDRKRTSKTTNFNGSFKYNLLKNLTYQVQGALRRRTNTNDVFYESDSRQARRGGGPYAQLFNSTDNGWSYTNTLTYRPRLLKNHNVNVMVGQEEKYRKFNTFSMSVKNFSDENNGLNSLQLGTTATVPITTVEGERDLSFFTRINYDYLKKYIVSVTYRMDGSSKFGDDHKWGHFPSASVAWRSIEEDFIKDLNVFSDLKVRFGVGSAGNNNIRRYRSQYRLTPGFMPENNQESNSVTPVQLANPNLKWETDVSVNLGFEMAFFNHRLQSVIDIYQNTAKDLLLERQIPYVTGYGTVLENIGETENRGIEVGLTYHLFDTKDFEWSTSLNMTYNKNKVKKLALSDQMPVRSGWAGDYNDFDYLLEVGSALGQMWGWESDGIYTVDDFNFDSATNKYTLKPGVVTSNDPNVKPGFNKYKDQNNDGAIDNEDRKVIGNANPKVYGGFVNNLRYKDFDFSFIINYSLGGKVYNANKMYFTKMDYVHNNSLNDVQNRFTYINEKGENVFTNPEELARINQKATWASAEGSSVSTMRMSDKFVENASFLRLSNITLGYTLPKQLAKKICLNNLRFYASANNLFTISGYSGFDPEVNTRPNGGLTPGIDWGAYPRAFSIIFGANLTF